MDQVLELLKEGKSVNEVSKITGILYQKVYYANKQLQKVEQKKERKKRQPKIVTKVDLKKPKWTGRGPLPITIEYRKTTSGKTYRKYITRTHVDKVLERPDKFLNPKYEIVNIRVG